MTDSPYARARALRLADIAREHGLDLDTEAGWAAVVSAYNAEQAVAGGFPVKLPAHPDRQRAREARDSMCVHGLRLEDCAGPDAHHVWRES